MKKLLSLLIAASLIFTSCSKERKLNKKLDGKWDGIMVSNGFYASKLSDLNISISFEFSKDKKNNGDVLITYTDDTGTTLLQGTYKLSKDEKITITSNNGVNDFEVIDYSDSEMTVKGNLNGIQGTLTLKKV